jgi:hypothetical protein
MELLREGQTAGKSNNSNSMVPFTFFVCIRNYQHAVSNARLN